MQKSVICRVGNEEYAIEIQNVVSIERMQSIRPIPQSPSYLTGIMELRDEIISIVDLRTWLGLSSNTTEHEERIIVVEKDKKRIGLVVDAATDVIDIDPLDIQELEENETEKDFKLIKLSNRLIVILDVAKIIVNM